MKNLKITKTSAINEKDLLANAQNFVDTNTEEDLQSDWGCFFGDGYVLVYDVQSR